MSVYLDNNASTPIDERVLDAMLPFMREQFGNPSGGYYLGRQARAAVNLAREQVAELVNAHPSQVIFTGSGTEANNLAIKGTADRMSPGIIAISSVEHPSVRGAALTIRDTGWEVAEFDVDESGTLSDLSIKSIASVTPKMMSVMLANNETGVINDIRPVSEVARQCKAVLHTDAVQAVGKVPVDFVASGVNMMSLSAHKLYGPKGAGALVVDKSIDVKPLLHGGGQEKGRRAGTENVAAIVGFGKAAELAKVELLQRSRHMQVLKEYLENRLLTECQKIRIFGQQAVRLPNTTFLAVPGIDGETFLTALDQDGFAVSSGSACSTGETEPSHVLMAMDVDKDLARGAIRVSIGKDSTQIEIDQFVEKFKDRIRIFQSYGAVA